MSEVISGNDGRPAEHGGTDPYGYDSDDDQSLDEATTPGAVRTALTDPAALAVGALPLAMLSLLGSQSLGFVLTLLSFNGGSSFVTPADQSRWIAGCSAFFALIAGGLGLAAMRRAAREDDTPRWVRSVAGGAVIIAVVGLAVAVLVVVVATVQGNPAPDDFGF